MAPWAPGMHRKSRHQVGFVEKLVLRANDEVCIADKSGDLWSQGHGDGRL